MLMLSNIVYDPVGLCNEPLQNTNMQILAVCAHALDCGALGSSGREEQWNIAIYERLSHHPKSVGVGDPHDPGPFAPFGNGVVSSADGKITAPRRSDINSTVAGLGSDQHPA
jgi:hypothetical protein